MGKGWKGRACWAVMRVARRVGGTEFSGGGLVGWDWVSWIGGNWEGWWGEVNGLGKNHVNGLV